MIFAVYDDFVAKEFVVKLAFSFLSVVTVFVHLILTDFVDLLLVVSSANVIFAVYDDFVAKEFVVKLVFSFLSVVIFFVHLILTDIFASLIRVDNLSFKVT